MKVDALVIGAGPAGSTAAFCLASAGWSVAIVEKSVFPRRKVCGEYLSPTNAPLLKALGVDTDIRRAAGPQVRRIGVFARDGVVTARMPSFEGSSEPWGRALGREKLDPLLLGRARSAGAKLWQPCAVVELRPGGGGQICRIAGHHGERVLRAAVVVAAHGSWERSALPTQRPLPHLASDLLAFKARFRHCDLSPDLMPLLAFPGGYGGAVRCDSGLTTLSLCLRRDALRSARARAPGCRAGEAVLEHVLAHCRGLRERFRRASLEGQWLAAGPIRPGIRSGYAADVFLTGNAAGEAHPIVAEGITMAMQGGALLARCLTSGQDDIGALRGRAHIGRAYSAAWRRQFGSRVRAAALFAQLAMSDRPVGLLLPVLTAWPQLLTFGGRLSGKVNVMDGYDSYGSLAR